jgi:hypothetical protein
MKHLHKPHPHPDRVSKALIVFNICTISMLILTLMFYYNVFEETMEHQPKLYQSLFISFFISITMGGIIANKYMRKSKEKHDQDIS